MNPRIVEVRKNIMKKNDVAAARLRERFQAKGMFVASFVSSPGAGKTAFLERTLTIAGRDRRVAALVGDLATEHDAERLRHSGVPVRQITTGTVCHLDAEMIERALAEWPPHEVEWLFVENVGNLVCPSSYDLGEHMRVVLFSVTEGEDKPLKYPTIFNTADAALVTKVDLAAAAEFDRETFLKNLSHVRPGLDVLEVSAKTGQGLEQWMAFLGRRAAAATRSSAPAPAGAV
jgi:hydrogenase nickel incorporation protein HypB